MSKSAVWIPANSRLQQFCGHPDVRRHISQSIDRKSIKYLLANAQCSTMESLQNLLNFQPGDWKFSRSRRVRLVGESRGFQYNRKSGNFALRHSSADKSMPGLLSEMGKACFSKWHRERLLRKASLRWLLSVSDDLILPARNSRFRGRLIAANECGT